MTDDTDIQYTYEFLPWRGLTRETMQFFNVSTKVGPGGKPLSIGYPYPTGATKVRSLAEKAFHCVGPASEPSLFGSDRFPKGSNKDIVITEGEADAASVYQMLNRPAVSVRSSSSAKKDCAANRDYLNSFDRIYLCLDNDDPGRKAAQEIAALFDFNKVYQVPLEPLKDANEYLQLQKDKEFRTVFANAKRFLPEGVVSNLSEFDSIIDKVSEKKSTPYPFGTLQDMTFGMRGGEFVLITAPEGIGKSEVMRAIEYHLLKTTTSPIAAIHLEESKARQLKGLAGYELNCPAHLPNGGVSNEEIKAAIRTITKGKDDVLHIYSHFGSDDPDILLDVIRFVVSACGCKFVFLDHITMIVTGLGDDDERKTLDYLSTRLATMCNDLDFTLFCVSHVNDHGQTRGSRNISKVAHLRIDLSRDLTAVTEEERNKTYLTISKNRFAGKTGPAGVLRFDPETYKLSEQHQVEGGQVPVN